MHIEEGVAPLDAVRTWCHAWQRHCQMATANTWRSAHCSASDSSIMIYGRTYRSLHHHQFVALCALVCTERQPARHTVVREERGKALARPGANGPPWTVCPRLAGGAQWWWWAAAHRRSTTGTCRGGWWATRRQSNCTP
eukprot:4694729-Prymnesium_polylepis.1